MADGDHLVVDPTKITDILNEQAGRLTKLETRVDGALNAAFVNYDPLVGQLSELRREFAKVLMSREALADRDRLWCKALIEILLVKLDTQEGCRVAMGTLGAVLKRFEELRDD